jgi:hypothetical protein
MLNMYMYVYFCCLYVLGTYAKMAGHDINYIAITGALGVSILYLYTTFFARS